MRNNSTTRVLELYDLLDKTEKWTQTLRKEEEHSLDLTLTMYIAIADALRLQGQKCIDEWLGETFFGDVYAMAKMDLARCNEPPF